MRKPFKKLGKESAVDIRAKIDGLEEHPGFVVFRAYFEERLRELRESITPLANNDFATVNQHNRRLHLAEAFDEVLRWAQDAREQCDSVVERT